MRRMREQTASQQARSAGDGDEAPVVSNGGCTLPAPASSARWRALDPSGGKDAALQILSALRVSMEHVRAARSFADALRAGARAGCVDCGFDRVVIFSVRGSTLEATEAFFGDRTDWASDVIEIGRANPTPITPELKESEALRRRRAILVPDAMADPHTPRPVVVASRTTGYVAAPLVCSGQVVGFIHADRHFSGRPVIDDDRQLLWTFAEAFGSILETAAIRDRVERQRRDIERILELTSTAVYDGPPSSPEQAAADAAFDGLGLAMADPDAGTMAFNGALTRRELEILRLVAAGRTNAAIADELVVTVNTVKSHVKHIMRKLGAANRAEAAAHFHRAQAARRRHEP